MSDTIICILLLAAVFVILRISERTKNHELKKLYRLLYQRKDFEAFHRELDGLGCTMLFSRGVRAYMLLNGAMTAMRPREEIEELINQIDKLKMSKREKEVYEEKKREYYQLSND